MSFKKIKFFAGFAVILLSLVVLVVSSAQKLSLYYFTLSELAGREDEFMGRQIKLAGRVVPGSIHRPGDSRTLEFQIREPVQDTLSAPSIRRTIRYRGVVPDTFRDDADVVLEGKLRADGIFIADCLLAKCPSKYQSRPAEDTQPSYGIP